MWLLLGPYYEELYAYSTLRTLFYPIINMLTSRTHDSPACVKTPQIVLTTVQLLKVVHRNASMARSKLSVVAKKAGYEGYKLYITR